MKKLLLAFALLATPVSAQTTVITTAPVPGASPQPSSVVYHDKPNPSDKYFHLKPPSKSIPSARNHAAVRKARALKWAHEHLGDQAIK